MTQRAEGKLAGYAYLAYIAFAMSAAILSRKTTVGADTSQMPFAYLLLAGRLIPRWMAWSGVITIGLQLVCVPLYVATLLPGRVVNWLWFPIMRYEVLLGIWLIRKGVQATP